MVSPPALAGFGPQHPHLVVQSPQLGWRERSNMLFAPPQAPPSARVAKMVQEPQPVVELRATARTNRGTRKRPNMAPTAMGCTLVAHPGNFAGKALATRLALKGERHGAGPRCSALVASRVLEKRGC